MEEVKMPARKVCLAASAGGHLNELLAVSEAWKGRRVFFVTTQEVVKARLEKTGPCYAVGESNRNQPLKALKVLGRCFKAILSEKPVAVVSTGALHGCLVCYIAKIFCGSKIVWLDSITNTDRPSLSGRLVYPIADVYLLQWPELLGKYPKAEFAGAVI